MLRECEVHGVATPSLLDKQGLSLCRQHPCSSLPLFPTQGTPGQDNHTQICCICACLVWATHSQQNITSSTNLETHSNLAVCVVVLVSSHRLILWVTGWALVNLQHALHCLHLTLCLDMWLMPWKINQSPIHWEIWSCRMLSPLNL